MSDTDTLYLSPRDWDFLMAELEKPARVIPALANAIERARTSVIDWHVDVHDHWADTAVILKAADDHGMMP